MATLKDLRTRFKKINIDNLVIECVTETKSIIIDLVRSQIESGRKANDSMPVYLNDNYAAKKQRMGSLAPYGIMDLKYTGNFLSKLYLKVYPNNFLIRSWDNKNSLLLGRFGPEIFLLSDDNLGYYVNQVLKPLLLSKI
jgi:hypothetical protein